MAQKARQPSMIEIIRTDYGAALASLFPVVFWGMYAAAYFGILQDPSFWFYLATASTLALLPVLIWRIRFFQAFFARGVEVLGIVTLTHRGGRRVEYYYVYRGESYSCGNAVTRTEKTKALQVEEGVMLLVDRDKPKRVIIRDLYVKGPLEKIPMFSGLYMSKKCPGKTIVFLRNYNVQVRRSDGFWTPITGDTGLVEVPEGCELRSTSLTGETSTDTDVTMYRLWKGIIPSEVLEQLRAEGKVQE